MRLYFSYKNIPELSRLTRRQQKAVYRCGLEAFWGEHPSRIWSGVPWLFGGIAIGSLAGWLAVNRLSLSSHFKLLLIAAGGVLGALIANFIAIQILNTQLRPYLRRVIEERADEVARIK